MEITLNVTLVTALIALVLTVVISFCSVFVGLGFVLKILLNPVKENQASLKENQVRLEQDLKQFKTEVNAKLDQLISQQSKQ